MRVPALTRRCESVTLSYALAAVLWGAGCSALEAELGVRVARSVFEYKGLSHIVAILCRSEDALLWERAFAESGSSFIATPTPRPSPQTARPSDAVHVLLSAQGPVGVFLQVGCSYARHVLRQSSAARLLGGSLHWVLAGNASTARVELERLVEPLDLGPSTEVTLAALASDSRTVHLVDVYRASPGPAGPGRPLLSQLTGTWTRAAGLTHFLRGSTAVRRRNLRGTVLRAGVLVRGFRDAELETVLGRPKDNHPVVSPVTAFSHTLTAHLRDMLNVTLRLQAGSFFGLLRRLARNDLHVLTTVTGMEARYWDVLDYSALPLWTERRVMMLKNPSALWASDGWLRPLDSKVWLIMVALILASALVLRAVGYWEVQFDPSHVEDEDSWGSAVTTALSIVCAQGFTTTTGWASSRALLLMFEFFSLFLNLFYTSGIVTFLLTFPPPYAQSVREVVESPFIVAVDRSVYSRANFTESRDSLMRELYAKKIEEAVGGGGFMSLKEAGDLTRDSRLALVGSPFPMYEVVARTWSQSDICRFHEIPLLPPGLLALATAKGSPFREIINQSLLLLLERGLLARERIRWSVARPRCTLTDVTELDFVGLRQVAPLLGFLVGGLILSTSILSVEMAYSKCGSRRRTVIEILKDVKTMVVSDLRKKAA